jgi:hypothetical protein
MKQIHKEYPRPFVLEATKLTSIVGALHARLGDHQVRDSFEVILSGNRREEVATLDALLALQNKKGMRVERMILTCSSKAANAGMDHAVEVEFGPKPGTEQIPARATAPLVAITVRSDEAAWAARTLSEVEEQVERTFVSHTTPGLWFGAILVIGLLFVLSQLHFSHEPADQSWSMWLRSADLDRLQQIVDQGRTITDDEMREVVTRQLRNLVEYRKDLQTYNATISTSPKSLLYFAIPFLLVLGCGVYLFARCYPAAVFKWGDEVARYEGLLQQRNLIWQVIIGVMIVGVGANLVSAAILPR